jgi:hypothetical protein
MPLRSRWQGFVIGLLEHDHATASDAFEAALFPEPVICIFVPTRKRHRGSHERDRNMSRREMTRCATPCQAEFISTLPSSPEGGRNPSNVIPEVTSDGNRV